jgi:hypothetical protein
MDGEGTGDQGQGTQAVEPVQEDLSAMLYPFLEWGPGQSRASLNAVFQNAQLQATKAIQWYEDHRRPQKRWARAFRCGALVLAGIAGILPIVSQILLPQNPDGGISLSPAWASVALALAAGLIGFDRFFGCSSSWLRYCVTDIRLKELLRVFQLDWQIANAARNTAGDHSQEEWVASMLRRARAFEMDVQALIRQETELWRHEFQSTLTQIDETARIARPSTLEVELPPRSDVAVPAKVMVRRAVPRPPSPPPPPSTRTPAPPRAHESRESSAPASQTPAIHRATDDSDMEPLSH